MIRTCIAAKSLKLVLPMEVDNSFGLFVQFTGDRSGLPVMEEVKEDEGQGVSCPTLGTAVEVDGGEWQN